MALTSVMQRMSWCCRKNDQEYVLGVALGENTRTPHAPLILKTEPRFAIHSFHWEPRSSSNSNHSCPQTREAPSWESLRTLMKYHDTPTRGLQEWGCALSERNCPTTSG